MNETTTTAAAAATPSNAYDDDMSNNLEDFIQPTISSSRGKPACSHHEADDVTSSTEGVLSDSLSDVQSMHQSSFARRSLLKTNSDDSSSSSSSCSSSDDDEIIDPRVLEESLSSLHGNSSLRLDVPLHRHPPGYKNGYDSLSFLKTIESCSEEEDFSDDDGAVAEDERGSSDEDDFDNLEALCSRDSKRTKLLGEGAFGQVWLVLHAHKAYALKVCSKYDLITEGAVQGVLRERQIHSRLHHPFICSLVATNQDENFLYMLQEFCAGGEFFSLLERQGGKLREGSARFYIACIADALRYLHENRIIYRDLKPENILIDQLGFPKLIDFGCAKQFDEKKEEEEESNQDYQTRTLCGTPRFVSPEMIEPERYGGGHSFPADYWALGILLYETLKGSSPYEYDGMTEGEVYESIVDEGFTPSLAEENSAAAKDLLSKLLVHNPAKRLGTNKEAQVLHHRWFADIDIYALRKRPARTAPWSPDLSDMSSTQYFDDWENVLESKFSQSYPTLTGSQRTIFVDF